MKKETVRLFLVILVVFCFGWARGEAGDPVDLRTVSAQDFLTIIRSPVRQNAWSVITGHITHARGDARLLKGNVRMSIRLAPSRMMTQITLDEKNTYILDQTTDLKTGKTSMNLESPEQESSPTLADFGLKADDLTFAFFYWDLLEELTTPQDAVNGMRVLRLKNPLEEGCSIRVHFNTKHGFPVEATWLDAQGRTQRTLELKGAKRHANGVWFVREMRLEDGKKAWKTHVLFDYVEKNEVSPQS